MLTILLFSAAGIAVLGVFLTLYILGLRRIVPTNEVHIVQRNAKTESYGKDTENGNVYYQVPAWIPKWGVVVSKLPSTIIDITLDKYEAYDKDRLPFVVDIKAFFRIQDFAIAASRVFTVAELKEQLTSIVQGAARSILAKEYLEDIMSKRSEYGEEFTREVAAQLTEWGVVAVKNIELMDIKDANNEEVIANIMMKKKSAIEMERRTEVAKNLKLAQESEILAKQEIELKKQDADRQVGLRRAQVEQEVGIANEQQQQQVQAQAKVTAEKEMEVKKVREVQSAEISKQAATVKAEEEKAVIEVNAAASIKKAEAQKEVAVLNAQANKEQTVLQAEANKEQMILQAKANKEQVELAANADKTRIELKADADLKAATNEAKGIKLKGESTANARELLEKAQVAGQIELKEKVTGDKDYQDFMIKQAQVEAMEKIGVEQAKNLSNADIKIFANAGSVADGVTQAGKVLSPKTGLDLGGLVESFASTPVGSEITKAVLNKLGDK